METPRLPHLLDPLGAAIPLSLPLTVLGRAAGCQVIIADRAASRRHAEIAGEGGAYLVRDLDSTNGTWLNGQRLAAPAHLRDGDLIEIGSARFIFRDPDATFATTRLPRLVYDEATGDLWVDRRPVQLSPKQHALFALLWARRDQVCGKDEIAAAVWPECQGEIYDYQIESLVKRLRAKLEPNPAAPALLLSAAGRGYRLAAGR
jgi:DNA-binding response OmpR family regulator